MTIKATLPAKRMALVEVAGERKVAEIIDTDWCYFLREEVALVKWAINAAPRWARIIREL